MKKDPSAVPATADATKAIAETAEAMGVNAEAATAQLEALNAFLEGKTHPDDRNSRRNRRRAARSQVRRDKLANLDIVRNTVAKSRNTLPDAREQYRIEQARKRLSAATSVATAAKNGKIDRKTADALHTLTQAHSDTIEAAA